MHVFVTRQQHQFNEVSVVDSLCVYWKYPHSTKKEPSSMQSYLILAYSSWKWWWSYICSFIHELYCCVSKSSKWRKAILLAPSFPTPSWYTGQRMYNAIVPLAVMLAWTMMPRLSTVKCKKCYIIFDCWRLATVEPSHNLQQLNELLDSNEYFLGYMSMLHPHSTDSPLSVHLTPEHTMPREAWTISSH